VAGVVGTHVVAVDSATGSGLAMLPVRRRNSMARSISSACPRPQLPDLCRAARRTRCARRLRPGAGRSLPVRGHQHVLCPAPPPTSILGFAPTANEAEWQASIAQAVMTLATETPFCAGDPQVTTQKGLGKSRIQCSGTFWRCCLPPDAGRQPHTGSARAAANDGQSKEKRLPGEWEPLQGVAGY
jgi:hypothetical protein